MRKIIVLLAIFVLLFATVFAGVENTPNVSNTQQLTNKAKVVAAGQVAPNHKGGVGSAGAVVRKISRTKIDNMKTTYVTARNKFITARNKYVTAKNVYLQKKEQYQMLKEEYNSASDVNKVKIKIQLRERAREVTIKQVETLVEQLEALKEKEIAPENVDELLSELEVIKLIMEDENATKEELVDALKSLKSNLIPTMRNRVQLRSAVALRNKISAILNKADIAKERVENISKKLSEKGYDTTLVDEALVKFSEKIADAETRFEEAKLKWDESETAEDKHAVIKEGFEIAKEINRSIIEGFQGLRDALKEIRALGIEELVAEEIEVAGDQE